MMIYFLWDAGADKNRIEDFREVKLSKRKLKAPFPYLCEKKFKSPDREILN